MDFLNWAVNVKDPKAQVTGISCTCVSLIWLYGVVRKGLVIVCRRVAMYSNVMS